jgi:hypothetical protein
MLSPKNAPLAGRQMWGGLNRIAGQSLDSSKPEAN